MPGWYDALDEQLDLMSFWSSTEGIRFGLAFQESLDGKMGRGDSEVSPLPIVELAKIKLADPIWVNDEVMELIKHAGEGFQPEPLLESDLLFPTGFMLLPEQAFFTDINGKKVGFRAIAWGTMVPGGKGQELRIDGDPETRPGWGIHISFYSHWDDEDDYTKNEWGDRLPMKWSLAHVTPWPFNKAFDGSDGATLDGAVYQEGDEVGRYGRLSAEQAANMAEGTRQLWSLIQVAFRLAQQKVVVAGRELPPRPYRRRAKRMDMPEQIVVMHLRKGMLAPTDGEGGEAHYSHRFPVSGHWRWQWYPSEKVHRQRWIHSYIKGPEDAPLIIKKRAANFVR